MDCIDCHNRPTHVFRAPDDAVDTSLALGRIDSSLPSIKKNAVAALAGDYATTAEAQTKIAATLRATTRTRTTGRRSMPQSMRYKKFTGRIFSLR